VLLIPSRINTGHSAHFREMRKLNNIFIFILTIITSCIERRDERLIGLWTNDTLDIRLSFDYDSVIDVNNLTNIKYSYTLEKDKIILMNIDSLENDYPLTYAISSDTLFIWYKTKTWENVDTVELLVYKKSNASNYYDHHLTKNGLTINLPKATTAKRVYAPRVLDMKIDYVGSNVKLFIGEEEVKLDKLDKFLSDFKAKHNFDNPYFPVYDYKCRLFIDQEIPCDFVIRLFPYLRKYSLNDIYFMTLEERIDPINEGFSGISYFVNPRVINLIEVKNAR
jgi:hypothetical protein